MVRYIHNTQYTFIYTAPEGFIKKLQRILLHFFADALFATEKTLVAPAIHSVPIPVRQESVLSGII